MKSDLQITFAPVNDSSQYCMVEQASTYMNIDMARKKLLTKKVIFCNCSMFYCTLLYVHSSIAIILMGKRELIALLNLSSW